MKKTSLFLFYFLCLSFIISAQNYHRFETYPLNDQIGACNEASNQKFRVKVNINIDYLLDLNKFYKIDLGDNFNLGVRYCKVLNRSNGSGDADFDLDSNAIQSQIDVCDFYRYHRFETFETLEKAKENICGQTTSHDGRWKANIKIAQLLTVGKVYLINLGNGLGTRYCKILNRHDGRGDADFDLDNLTTLPNEVTIDCSDVKPDLEAVKVSVSSSTINHGENKTVNYEVKNIGKLTANPSRCKFYLSKNGRLVDLLDNISIGSVNVNQTKTGSVTLTIPLGTATDTYNIVMEVSTSGESDTGNNTITSSSNFRVNGIQALPNLTLESLKINVTNQGSFNVFPGGNIPTFRYNSSTNFEIKIKNNDDGDSGNFSCLLLVSGSNDAYPQPNGFPVYNFRTLNFSGINANSSSMLDITETIYDYIGGLDLLEGQTYFMYLHIDYDEDVTESNENDSDNISHFAFRYNNPTNKMSNPQKNNQQQFLIDTYNSAILKENYKVDIFDLTGRLVKSIKSDSIEQENKIINTLPSGLYIIKTPSGFRKIAK